MARASPWLAFTLANGSVNAHWIIGLGPDYDYALVGTPSRRWGWILAREPKPSVQRINAWFERLREQGYDPMEFVLTKQQ